MPEEPFFGRALVLLFRAGRISRFFLVAAARQSLAVTINITMYTRTAGGLVSQNQIRVGVEYRILY